MPVVAPDGTVAHPYAHRSELGPQGTFGALPPCHTPPRACSQDLLGCTRLLVRHGFAGTTRRPHELHVGIVDRLVLGDAHGPSQPPSIKAVAEGGTGAIAGIGQDRAEPHATLPHAVEFSQGDLTLASCCPHRLGYACPGAALWIGDPLLRQE